MLSTKEIATKIVEYCKKGENLKAIHELYARDIVSIEPMTVPPMPAESKGLEAVLGKTNWWLTNHQIHSHVVKGPFLHGDRFIVYFEYDVTPKATGKRMNMVETGLYFVTNGKISREEFFYGTEC